KSINAIRERPLDETAVQKGVQKTEPLTLSNLPNDPQKDNDVSALMWEIRRERRMEFVYEFARLNDIRRWAKLDKMAIDTPNSDDSLGPWVDFPQELPARIKVKYEGVLKIVDASGNEIVYDGTNDNDMIGFYKVERVENRESFSDRVYLAPVGINQIQDYTNLGYTLSQTKGWE